MSSTDLEDAKASPNNRLLGVTYARELRTPLLPGRGQGLRQRRRLQQSIPLRVLQFLETAVRETINGIQSDRDRKYHLKPAYFFLDSFSFRHVGFYMRRL